MDYSAGTDDHVWHDLSINISSVTPIYDDMHQESRQVFTWKLILAQQINLRQTLGPELIQATLEILKMSMERFQCRNSPV